VRFGFRFRQNLVSLLVGYVATLIVIPLVMSSSNPIGLFWPFLPVGISIVTERQYLNAQLSPSHVPWLPIAAANVISTASCLAVVIVVANLESTHRNWAIVFRPYEAPLTVIAAACSLVLLVGSFFVSVSDQGGHRTTELSDAADSR